MAQAVNPYETPKSALGEAAGQTQPVSLFSVSGRIGRARYIAYSVAAYVALSLVGGILALALGQGGIVPALTALTAMLVLGFMLTIQRCHDFDTSGWLSILLLVPVVNLVFWFIPGTDGPNRYGPPTPPNGAPVIIGACVAPVVLVVIILAAVAIPAGTDYRHRARVSEAIVSTQRLRAAVSEHHAETQSLPGSAAELRNVALASPSESRYGKASVGANGVITLTMSSQLGPMADKTIVLQPQIVAGELRWDCTGGTLPAKFRPASCRRY